jgi:hypothetical protein
LDSLFVAPHGRSHQDNGAIHPLVLYPIPWPVSSRIRRSCESPHSPRKVRQAPTVAAASPPNNDRIPESTRRGARTIFPDPPRAADLPPPQHLTNPMQQAHDDGHSEHHTDHSKHMLVPSQLGVDRQDWPVVEPAAMALFVLRPLRPELSPAVGAMGPPGAAAPRPVALVKK